MGEPVAKTIHTTSRAGLNKHGNWVWGSASSLTDGGLLGTQGCQYLHAPWTRARSCYVMSSYATLSTDGTWAVRIRYAAPFQFLASRGYTNGLEDQCPPLHLLPSPRTGRPSDRNRYVSSKLLQVFPQTKSSTVLSESDLFLIDCSVKKKIPSFAGA